MSEIDLASSRWPGAPFLMPKSVYAAIWRTVTGIAVARAGPSVGVGLANGFDLR